MGKFVWNVGVASVLTVAALLSPLPRAASRASPPISCNGQPVASPMQGHYTGAWHSDGDYHFSAFNTDIDLKITIDGKLDATVAPDGTVSGTATGNVDAPIFHDGKQDVSSGIGTISGSVSGTLAGGGAGLALAHPVIDMHWGTFGGHAIERFITMPDYQFPAAGSDCISGRGTIAERDFPVQIIVPDGVSANPVQVPGIGSAGGSWQIGSDKSDAFNRLSQQVDGFIKSANDVLADPSITLTPALTQERITGPLRTLETAVNADPDLSRCLLERLAAWEATAASTLTGRAHELLGTPDLLSMRRAVGLLRSASLVSPDCLLPAGGLAALLDTERTNLDRAVARRAWSDVALLTRELLLTGGEGARGGLGQEINADLHGLTASTSDAAGLLEIARMAYALGDDGAAADAVRRLADKRTGSLVRDALPAKKKKHTKTSSLPPGVKPAKPSPTATPTAAPKTLDQILTSGVPAIVTGSPSGSPPLFSWNAAVSRYVVVVTQDGAPSPLWTWSGTETSVRYGDIAVPGVADTAGEDWPLRLDATAYRWSVIGLDANGHIMGLRLRARP